MGNCKKHAEKEVDTWFDDLTRYLVNRNLNEKRFNQEYSDIFMQSFIYITYQIPKFKDLLGILIEILEHLNDHYASGKGVGVGDKWEETFDEDQRIEHNYVFDMISLRDDPRIDKLFVMNAVYLISQIDDFRDLVQILAGLDKQCGEFEELNSKKS